MLYEIPLLVAGSLVTASLTLPDALNPHTVFSFGLVFKWMLSVLVMYGLVIAIRELPIIRYRLLFSALLVLNLLPFILWVLKAFFLIRS